MIIYIYVNYYKLYQSLITKDEHHCSQVANEYNFAQMERNCKTKRLFATFTNARDYYEDILN